LDLHERPLKLEVFNPSELMEDLLERFRPILIQKGLRLTKEVAYGSTFFGDKEVLQIALSNVLDNATKFVPEKGHLIVKIYSEDSSLLISITNTFQALPEEDLSRILEPFNRTEQSPATGYGLGLSITKKIIEKHGGHIAAFNAMEGFEIRIRLPKRQDTQL
jgi:signal transduction histidine kinase